MNNLTLTADGHATKILLLVNKTNRMVFFFLSWVTFRVRSGFHRCVKSCSFQWDVSKYILNEYPEDQGRWDQLKITTPSMKKCHVTMLLFLTPVTTYMITVV